MQSPGKESLDVKETPGSVFSPLTEAPEDEEKFEANEEDDEDEDGPIMTEADWDARVAKLEEYAAALKAMSLDNKREIRKINKANQARDKEVQNLSGKIESCQHQINGQRGQLKDLDERTQQNERDIPKLKETVEEHEQRLQIVETTHRTQQHQRR
mmetsp:Transcript_3776/g.7690  ORF Transcript_3776/g.7690 Transcript_3776/m.7690 type:complete len:156 (+) Transcript_3776:224-691(+)